jgi:hypothetical protein
MGDGAMGTKLTKEEVFALSKKLIAAGGEVDEIIKECELVYNDWPDAQKKEQGKESTKLYLCNKELVQKLLTLQARLDEGLSKERQYDPYRFKALVNLLNPTQCAGAYSIVLRTTAKLVSDPSKVEKYVDRELQIAINVIHSNAEALIRSDPSMSSQRASAIRLEANANVTVITQEGKKLLDDFKLPENERRYDVRISSAHRAYMYAYCDFLKKQAILRDNVPNVLFFEKQEYRPNHSTPQFLKKATCPFGDVFYIDVTKELP